MERGDSVVKVLELLFLSCRASQINSLLSTGFLMRRDFCSFQNYWTRQMFPSWDLFLSQGAMDILWKTFLGSIL